MATFLTFTPGATANSGSIDARITGAGGGGSGALLVPMSYTNINKDGLLTFDHAGGGRLDTLIFDGTAGNDIFDVTVDQCDDIAGGFPRARLARHL